MIGMIGFRKALCVGITAAALAVLAVPAGAADEHEQHHPAPGGAAMEQSQAMPGAAGGMGMCSMMQRQGGGPDLRRAGEVFSRDTSVSGHGRRSFRETPPRANRHDASR